MQGIAEKIGPATISQLAPGRDSVNKGEEPVEWVAITAEKSIAPHGLPARQGCSARLCPPYAASYSPGHLIRI